MPFSAKITAFALENRRLEDLPDVFVSAKKNQRILPILDIVGRVMGSTAVIKQIYEEKGLESFAKLYNSVYQHLYDTVLPEYIDLNDPKTNAVLDHFTYFTGSKFARADLTLAGIYGDYLADYKAGRIAHLPKDLPPARLIEVATTKHQGLTQDASRHYQQMMRIVDMALTSVKAQGSLVYASCMRGLIEAMTERIAVLQKNMANPDLPEIARKQMDEQLRLLRDAESRLGAGSDKEGLPLLLLDSKQLQAMGRLPRGDALMQEMLITHALAVNARWRTVLETVSRREASGEGIRQFVDFWRALSSRMF